MRPTRKTVDDLYEDFYAKRYGTQKHLHTGAIGHLKPGDIVEHPIHTINFNGQVHTKLTVNRPLKDGKIWFVEIPLPVPLWAFSKLISCGSFVYRQVETRKGVPDPVQPKERRKATMSARAILEDCADLIKERGVQRDKSEGERSMARTVAAFNAMTGHKLSEEDGWLFMQYLKDSRSRAGKFQLDDYLDKVAYAALQSECALKNQ